MNCSVKQNLNRSSTTFTESVESMGDIAENIMCMICEYFLVDAVTLNECLHFFCRTCLLKHLKRENRCPKCFQELGTDLETAFRRERTHQNLVYKLVPDLFWRQLKRRRKRIAAIKRRGDSPSERRLSSTRRMVCFSERLCKFDEKVSLSIEYIPLIQIIEAQTTENISLNSSPIFKTEFEFLTNKSNLSSLGFKKYFSCLSQVSIKELRELIELDLGKNFTIYFVDPTLQTVLDDDLSLQDFIYIYTWNRRSSLNLFFTIINVSSLDEDKPPVLEVEESLPQLNAEFSKSINEDENKQNKKNSTVLSSSPLIDSELTIPRLAVSLPSSAFNNALRDGVHQPIITTFLPENDSFNKHSSTETLKISSQQRKRKKNSSEVNEKIKKSSKKQLLTINNSPSSSKSTQVSTIISTQNSKLESSVELSKSAESKDSLKIPTSCQNLSSFNNNCAESTSKQNVSLNNNQKSTIQPMNTLKSSLNSKVSKSKTLEQQLHQQLKRVQNCAANSTSNNQNLSLINKLSNLSPMNNDNIFSQNIPSAQSSSKNLSADTSLSSSSLTTGVLPVTAQHSVINNADFKSISPQQQEAAMRAYYQLIKFSQNNDAMSACLLAASNTTNSMPFNNFYNVMAAAASNQFFAALCNNVTPPTSLALNKISDLNLFSVGNVLNNGKKINDTDNLTNKVKQKTGQQDFLKKQQNHLNRQKETAFSNDNKIKTKMDEIVMSNSPSTSNKVVSMINSQKSIDKHQNKNSKTSFYDTSSTRLSTIGASPILSANSS